MRDDRLRWVVFGLGISSSWGNGHATLWRGLIRALTELGHEVFFFERDVPYYAQTRDLFSLPKGELILYRDLDAILPTVRELLRRADCAMVTSYCPDARAISPVLLEETRGVRVFYDLDTGVTVERAARGEDVEYIPAGGLSDFDLVLSYTGGRSAQALREWFGARRVEPLYGSADPAVHFPAGLDRRYAADLSYIGTWAANRQQAVETLFLEPLRRLPTATAVVAGSLYPDDFRWPPNVRYLQHLPPAEHPSFYSSSRLTLSVTREPMAALGYCPSARYFEAALCGTPVLSDHWDGLSHFFEPGREILVAGTSDEVVEALSRPPEELRRIGAAARRRTLAEHTAAARAQQLIELIRPGACRAPGIEARP